MAIETLQDLLEEELKDLYNAENQLVKALPRMAKKVQAPELKEAILQHLEETKTQVQRLEEAAQHLEIKLRGKKCLAMEGLIAEGQEQMEEDMEPQIKDQALIGAAQKIEHYEISGYGTARTLAQRLGLDEVVELLQQTLDEESAADEKLTQIAEALEIPGEEEEEEGAGDAEEDQLEEEEPEAAPAPVRARGGRGGRR